MSANFPWNARGRLSLKRDPIAGSVCACQHPELSHETIDGVSCGPCLFRGCGCESLDVAEAVADEERERPPLGEDDGPLSLDQQHEQAWKQDRNF